MNEIIDYTVLINEIIEKVNSIFEILDYIRVLIISIVSLYIFDFIWKKIRQPKRLRGGIDE